MILSKESELKKKIREEIETEKVEQEKYIEKIELHKSIIDDIKANYLNGSFPEELIDPLLSSFDYSIKFFKSLEKSISHTHWNEFQDSEKILNRKLRTEKILSTGSAEASKKIFLYLFSCLDYPNIKFRYRPKEQFSTYLYQYIRDFRKFFKKVVYYLFPTEKAEKLEKLCDRVHAGPEELLYHLEETPLYRLLNTAVPLSPFPFQARFEHTHIVAGTGHGKTQLIQFLLNQDIKGVQADQCGFCIIDSQADLINNVLQMAQFDPQAKNSLADRVIYINPEDVAFSPCLNIFDMQLDYIKGLDPLEQEKVFNSAVSLYEYIFSDLVDGRLTMYQQNIFQFCAKLLLSVPRATIKTFIDLLQHSENYRTYVAPQDEVTKEFFEKEFLSPVYESTKRQISARLWAVIRNNTFQRMFLHEKNKLDIFEAMNAGKILLINTSKAVLQTDGARILGKFFVAMIFQGALQRASIPEKKRRPFFVYIDEAYDYMNDQMAEALNQTRKYKVGFILAHQFLKQLDDVSTNLRSCVMTNTSMKFVGGVNEADANAMSREMGGTDPMAITSLKKEAYRWAEYYCFVRHSTRRAIKIRVPFGIWDNQPKISEAGRRYVIEQSREKYCESVEKRETEEEEYGDAESEQAEPQAPKTEKRRSGLGRRAKL